MRPLMSSRTLTAFDRVMIMPDDDGVVDVNTLLERAKGKPEVAAIEVAVEEKKTE